MLVRHRPRRRSTSTRRATRDEDEGTYEDVVRVAEVTTNLDNDRWTLRLGEVSSSHLR